jgi:hypothetical protein
MKKLMVLILVLSMAASAFAENGLTVGGDAATGFRVTKEGDGDAAARLENTDVGNVPGRFRLNFNYTKDNIQVKWRTQMTSLAQEKDQFQSTLDNVFEYAFAMGDFFDNQFRVSVGKLGDSGDRPWEMGNSEVWGDVEGITGARFEFKPAALAGLNVGLLMPALASSVEPGDYFSELGFGIRYDHDAFAARFAIRLDGEGDPSGGGTAVWHLEARAIGSAVPGLKAYP